MRLLEARNWGETVRVIPDIVVLYYSVYGAFGLSWQWDNLDLTIAAVTAYGVLPRLWRDGWALHHHLVIRPRESVLAVERNARRARRSAAQAFLRKNRHAR